MICSYKQETNNVFVRLNFAMNYKSITSLQVKNVVFVIKIVEHDLVLSTWLSPWHRVSIQTGENHYESGHVDD